jgi:hypothetical protein
MRDVDPADVAADMLREALPGFAAKINPATDSIVVDGVLRIGSTLPAEAAHNVVFPIYRDGFFEAPAARMFREALMPDDEREVYEREQRAKQTEALKRELAPLVAKIVEDAQRFGIEALGLKPVIAERVEKARREGRSEGFLDGREQGRRDGRREMLEELAAAAVKAGILYEAGTIDDE